MAKQDHVNLLTAILQAPDINMNQRDPEIETLLKAGSKTSEVDRHSRNLLLIAVCLGSYEVTELLYDSTGCLQFVRS